MKGKYLIAIAFLASWTVITANKLPVIIADPCPPVDVCPPVLISHAECNKYYECRNGRPLEIVCAAGLYFSKTWRGCVDRQISDCPVTPSPTPTPSPSPTPPGQCRHRELIAHECQCDKFYECIYGRKALRDCPVNYNFNPSTLNCEWGPCKNSTTPVPEPEPEPVPECKNGELLPHECICTKYYYCKGGKKALRNCPDGMHFDNVTMSGCIPGDCIPPPRNCTDGDRMQHPCRPKHCDLYFECINGDWILQHCGEGDHFDNKTNTCMDKVKAGCDCIPLDYCVPQTPPLWSHECDCRLYYDCENNEKKLYACKWGDYFDKDKQKCDETKNVRGKCKNDWDSCV